MPDKSAPMLFFEDLDCVACSMYLFDEKEEEWSKVEDRPRNGDHVVVDGTEMVQISPDKYRDLNESDVELWDLSIPDMALIEELDRGDEEEGKGLVERPVKASRISPPKFK